MKSLTLSVLLLSTTILTARADYTFELVGDIIKGENKAQFNVFKKGQPGPVDQQIFEIKGKRLLGFAKEVPLTLKDIDPFSDLPSDLGFARKQEMCTILYKKNKKYDVKITSTDKYPLQGKWHFQEDLKEKKTTPVLILQTQTEDGILRFIDKIFFDSIPFEFVSAVESTSGNYFFDPYLLAYQSKTSFQTWKKRMVIHFIRIR